MVGREETDEVIGESGDRYQLEVQALWDGKVGETLRVIVSEDDGGWRALGPISGDFTVASDGSFVGE